MKQETKQTSVQFVVDTIVTLPGGTTMTDSVYVNISEKEPQITISIDNNDTGTGPEHSANYQFYGDNFQQLVNWLRSKNKIK